MVNKQINQTQLTEDGNIRMPKSRHYVVVSGYYGFDNLGDEAILEELISQLTRFVRPEDIVVLSADPHKTASMFGVGAIDRTDFFGISDLCKLSRLFVSGGGGLFQNTKSHGSILFYALHLAIARTFGSPILIYAQGIGPLNGPLASWITKRAFAAADAVLVRDDGSKALLDSWGIPALRTADPVWSLKPGELPAAVMSQLDNLPSAKLVGLSLRTSPNFTQTHLRQLVESMRAAIPETDHLIALPLQTSQDTELLQAFKTMYEREGKNCSLIDTSSMRRPSEWISLFSKCRCVVAMRFHALIMSLKAGVPVIGIAYDPKVSQLLAEFEQPSLILTKETEANQWKESLKAAFLELDKLSLRATMKAESAKNLACQNLNMIDRILKGQRFD